MDLITDDQRHQLLQNAANRRSALNKPIVRLFAPWASATWLISELDPNDHDQAWGLCDLGLGAELGALRLSDLQALRGPGDARVKRDLDFIATSSIGEYAAELSLL